MSPLPLLLILLLVLMVAGVYWLRRHHRSQQSSDQTERQIWEWKSGIPIEILGGRLVDLPEGNACSAFILMFWNNSGVSCSGITVRLVDLRAGVGLKPIEAQTPSRPMPLRLLPRADLSKFRERKRPRPLARLNLGPYERGEVELGELCEDNNRIVVHHENGEAHFLLHTDYEFRLQVSTRQANCSLSIGLKKLQPEKRWISSLPSVTTLAQRAEPRNER